MSVSSPPRSSPAAATAAKQWHAVPTPVRTVEEVTQLLHQGADLDELRLCWYQPQNKNDGKGLLTKRNIAALEKALKKTPSHSIQSLSVGWKHGGDRKNLIKLLELFVRSSSLPALESLGSFELVLDAWLPEPILMQLLVPQAQNLKRLHIQATRMKVRTKDRVFFKNAYQSAKSSDPYVLREQSVVQLLSAPPLSRGLSNLTSLAFIDCDVLDEDVDVLVRFLWQRPVPVKNLSLRSNRHMSPEALQLICQAPVTEKLDLSLCDIGNLGALSMERAFAPNNRLGWRQLNGLILKELAMSGNYQLDHIGFVALCHSVPTHVEHWNLSYCDMTEHQTLSMLNELICSLPPTNGPLKEFSLQGAKVANEDACQALGRLLRTNRTLTTVRVDDPKYPMAMASRHLKYVVDGLQYNYVLQQLHVDMFRLKEPEEGSPEAKEDERVRDGLNFYLLLNRAGRKIMQSEQQVGKEEWIQTLENAMLSRRLDVIYWVLRNSVVQMF